jgi:DNA-binding transcriptional LysR family regulator
MVASPAYLKKYGTPKTPDDLYQHQIIMLRFATGVSVPWNLRVKGKVVSFEAPSPSLILTDTAAVGDAAVMGLGITLVSQHFAWPHLQAGRLKVVLHSFNEPGTRELVLHYPHREHVAPRIRAFVEYALETLQSDPTLQVSAKSLMPFCV